MSKPTLVQPVSDEGQTITITSPNLAPAAGRLNVTGGWVRMRPMTIDDLLALGEADTQLGPAIRAVKSGCVESKFENGKPLGEQGWTVMTEILKAWNASEDEVAIPPANGQP